MNFYVLKENLELYSLFHSFQKMFAKFLHNLQWRVGRHYSVRQFIINKMLTILFSSILVP